MSHTWDTLFERGRYYDGLLLRYLGGEQAGALRPVIVHALTGPGKRLRCLLTEALGTCWKTPPAGIERAAVAVEYLHCASLLLDDLPAMDQRATRRGRPATHVIYGEAAGILGALALIARAFELLAEGESGEAAARLGALRGLARAIGLEGLCGGQFMDLAPPDPDAPESAAAAARVRQVHALKTGSLFAAIATLLDGVSPAPGGLGAWRDFLELFGLTFQIADDLHDAAEDSETGCNAERLLGRGRAAREAEQNLATMRRLLAELPAPGDPLLPLLDWLEDTIAHART